VAISEATDPALSRQWVTSAKRDFVQQKLDADQKMFEKLYAHDHPESLLWSVKRNISEPDS
jgi:hypothetical protein